MWTALKKQAETYFQGIQDLEKVQNQAAGPGELQRFYTLLICKYLPTAQLSAKLIALYTSKSIKWDIFINAIWGFSLSLTEQSQLFKSLAKFLSEIDSKNIIERSYIMKSLPQNLIDAAGLEKKQTLQKKANRAYTKFYYDQKKHNLLRENNEGYAKLCLLLATLNYSHNSETVWNKVLSLIGNFDLDPDRVLDLLIESFVQSANPQICLNLIKNFNPQSIVTLIGNRILKDCSPQKSQKIVFAGKIQNFLSGTPQQLHKQLQSSVNPKLINLLCKLIKQNIIKFDFVLPYLFPLDSVFEKQQSKRFINGKQKISKSFKLMMQELTPEELDKLKQEQNLKFSGQMIYSSKLALLHGFVLNNDWFNFMNMWKDYRSKIDLIIYQPLIRTLIEMLQWVIDPLYSKISFSKFFKNKNQTTKPHFIVTSLVTQMKDEARRQMTQCVQLNQQQFGKILQIFQIVKIYIGFSTKVFIKICRLFSKIISNPKIFDLQKPNQSMPAQNTYTNIKQKIEGIIKSYLVPGISLQSGNPSLPKQLYELLQLFDYRFRYSCYMKHYSETMTNNPYLANVFYKTRNKQIVIVNNMSDKNKKIFMKKMAKITHNQALQTFYWIFRRIMMEDYQKVVPQIVSVLANSCSLTLQMSIFIALHILNQQKQPAMNFKTGQQAPWFKNLINFISLFYRKYLQIDIQPVFDYIIMKIGQPVEQLQLNQQLPGALLKLLNQILSKMFCNFILKEVNKSKLEILCAGPKLQLEAMDISQQIKASKKSKVILQKFFWGKSVDQYDGQSLAISLLVLLTQKRAELLHKSYISNLKIIGDIYDDYTIIIIQLIRVLNQLSTGYTQYSKLLPENSLNLLINQYKLPMEIAFQIYRPSIKHISFMANQQWTNFVQQIGIVLNKFIVSDQKYINRCEDNQKLKNYLIQNYAKINNVISIQFFVTFWMLTLDSIYFPGKLYSQKIQQVKKKAQAKINRAGKSQKSQREIEKAKTLLTNLKNQEASQQKKVQQSTNQQNSLRLKVQFFKNGLKDDVQQFAQIFVQICLLPRMMLDPQEALYCMKITLQVIKINKLSSGKSIKLLLYVIQHVMNYLPYSSQRQATYCLSIFLSEMLSLTNNWNDSSKLKIDMKKFLGVEENFVQQNYARLKKQFLKLFIRFGNIVKSIKDEPYSIRNCLYLLQKVDSIPAYKKQAEQMENYLKQLKQKYASILPTILEMQLSIMATKKKTLPIIQQEVPVQQFPRPQFVALVQAGQKLSPFRNINIANNKNDMKNQLVEKTDKGGINLQNQTKQLSIDEKRDSKKQSKTEKQIQKNKQIRNQKQNSNTSKTPEPSLQVQKQKNSNNQTYKQKLVIELKENGGTQVQKQIDKKEKQSNILLKTSPINVPASQTTESIMPPIQTVGQRKAAEIHDKERQNHQRQKIVNQQKPQAAAQRIITVAQWKKGQIGRKPINNPLQVQPQQPQPNKTQPQITEKMIKQNKKDLVPRNQIAQWPKQEERKKQKQSIQLSMSQTLGQPTVQFRKNSIQDKKIPKDLTDSRNQNVQPIKDQKQVNIEILPAKQIIDLSQQQKVTRDNNSQEKQRQRNNHSRSKDKAQQQYRAKDNKIEWNRDKYSPERNQEERERQYKRETRNQDKRQKYQRTESRWKQEYRDKHNQERNNQRRKESKDRNRRKQDKYERQRDRDRKHDLKGKDRQRDRQRQRDYRK